VRYAFIRVSDGTGFIDPKFETYWAGSRANGILHGAYQYFRPNQDPIAQADLMLSKIGTLAPDDLPPVIDVEADGGLSPSQVAAKVKIWVDRVSAATGRTPIVYTGFYFWRDQVGAADLTTSPLWHAQYTTAMCPTIAPPWQDWAFWQYTSSGRVAGIAGNVDMNRFNGTREDLLTLTAVPRTCGAIEAGGGTVDDGDACFQAGGPQTSLRPITDAGEQSDLLWTYATEDAEESNFAHWNLALAEAGRYRVEVSTPAAYARSTQARYAIRANGAMHEVAIDQTAVDGWQLLGELEFAAGGDQFVHLGDNTGELLADRVQLVFDAVRLTRVTPAPDDDDLPEPPPAEGGGCDAGGGGGLAIAAARAAREPRTRSGLRGFA
jgi:hypothetical protein